MGYEDLDTVAAKATWAGRSGLRGVAIFDLSMDDFKGECENSKFPLTMAANIVFKANYAG